MPVSLDRVDCWWCIARNVLFMYWQYLARRKRSSLVVRHRRQVISNWFRMGRELRSSRGVPENYIQQRLSMISERLTSRIYVHTITAKKSFVGKRCCDNSVLQLTVCSKSIFNKKLNDRMLTRLFDHRRPKPATPRCIRVSTIPTRTHNVCCVLQSSTNEGLLAV